MANPLRYQDPGLVDTRCIGNLKRFDGADANWTLRSFQAESFFGLMPKPVGMNVNIEDLLDFSVGVDSDTEVDMARMSLEVKEEDDIPRARPERRRQSAFCGKAVREAQRLSPMADATPDVRAEGGKQDYEHVDRTAGA